MLNTVPPRLRTRTALTHILSAVDLDEDDELRRLEERALEASLAVAEARRRRQLEERLELAEVDLTQLRLVVDVLSR